MLPLYLLIPGTGMVFPFPNPFVGNFAGKKQHNGSPHAMQTLSEEPGASFSKNETRTTVKRSLELGLTVLQKEDQLSVQSVNLPKKTSVRLLLALHQPVDPQTCSNFLLLLTQCPELSLRKNKKPGCTVRGRLFRLWRFGQVLLLQRII